MPHINFQLPVKGIHLGGGVETSPALTSGHMDNVRARDTLENSFFGIPAVQLITDGAI